MGHDIGGQDLVKRAAAALSAALVAVALAATMSGSARATFPGPVGRLAFVTDRDGNENIYTMNPDGSNPARVTTDPAADTSPSWDRRGWNIFYVSTRSGLEDVFSVDDTGGNAKTIIANSGSVELSPASDIAGDTMVFQTDRDGDDEIYNSEDNGKNPKNLTLSAAAEDIDPAVSASNMIAFASDRQGAGDLEIFTMKLDGSEVRRRTPVPALEDYDNYQPDWSPNSARIAFVSTREGDPDIFVMNADGTGVVRLTDSTGADQNPTWSPDGTQIAFDSDRDGNLREIYVMNADGSSERRITNNGVDDFEPAWQRVNKERHAFGVDDKEIDDATSRSGGGGAGVAAVPQSQPQTVTTSGAGGNEEEEESNNEPIAVLDETVQVDATSSRAEEPADLPFLPAIALLTAVFAATLSFTLRPRRRSGSSVSP